MSINDIVEMNILCLICFSICAKMQGFVHYCVFFFNVEIQDGCQKWRKSDFWENHQ